MATRLVAMTWRADDQGDRPTMSSSRFSKRCPERMKVLRDMPGCSLCGSKDSDADPIGAGMSFRWGKPSRNGKNQGGFCYYCLKTYHARFHIKFANVELLKQELGKNAKVKTEFNTYRAFALTQMQDAGKADVRISWTLADHEAKQLTHHQESICAVQKEDNAMLYADYLAAHGDPTTNGKGHQRRVVQGIDMVVLPGSKVFKLLNTSQVRADLQHVVDDGQNQLGENQVQDNFAALSMAIAMPTATGISLDELFGRPQHLAAGAATSAASSSSCPAAEQSHGWGLSQAIVSVPAPVQAEEPSGIKAGAKAGPKAGKPARPKNRAEPSGSAVGGNKRVGRPKRDVKQIAQQFVEQFRTSTSEASYFTGKEQHAQKKWMDSLIEDVDRAMAECTAGDAEFVELTKFSKQVHVIIDMTRLQRFRPVPSYP